MVDCANCIEKCPQAAAANEAAKGRMFAEREFIDLVKKIENGTLVEVRHGRWVHGKEDGYPSICSVCKYPVDRFYKTNYCPNCGAKMDGGADDAADLCG